jgi:hypothetical protein
VPVNPDFRDLFAALNEVGARYLLVGGYAVAFHAQPRFTELTAADPGRPGTIFQIGVPPNRTDVVTAIDGVSFPEAWQGRVETTYGDETVPVIGRSHLVQNKRAAGRPQDLPDLEILEGD